MIRLLDYSYDLTASRWRYDCLACGLWGVAQGSPYNKRGIYKVATRHKCKTD